MSIRDDTIMVVQGDEVNRTERVARKVVKHIEDFVERDLTSDQEFSIYTVPTGSTPKPSWIYNSAFDGVVSSKEITGTVVIGTEKTLKSSVTRNVEEIGYPHNAEQILSDWGFNFNDSKVARKRNLHHVFFTGKKNDAIYSDISGVCILGWATDVKCKSGGIGKFSGSIHMHELVASPESESTIKIISI